MHSTHRKQSLDNRQAHKTCKRFKQIKVLETSDEKYRSKDCASQLIKDYKCGTQALNWQ